MFGRIIKTLALTLVLGAVFAGSAAASAMIERVDLGTAQSSQPIVSEKTAGLYPATHPLISEKLGGLKLQSEATSGPPLVSEKLDGLNLQPTDTAQVATTGGGFDWNDAGIGAAITFAALLAAMVSVLAFQRHRGQLAH